jgi:2-polyprenyl-6-methoxyphenol hydroxylase-like FAD-dependent oxidoreductase
VSNLCYGLKNQSFLNLRKKGEGGAMTTTYDIITVGGGLGGASLAKAMAEHGAKVLVLERETQFKDRVRGEQMSPWGVAEAQALGLYTRILNTCGHNLPWFDTYMGPTQTEHRDLVSTTPQQAPMLIFYHPAMQEELLQAAATAGAEVRRGSRVSTVKPGATPTVTVEHYGRTEEIPARLVVGADGRASLVRKWAGFSVHKDPDRRLMAGVLFEEMSGLRDDTNYVVLNPSLSQIVALFPQGHGRVRAYLGYPKANGYRLQGETDVSRFIEGSVQTGAAAEWYQGVRMGGPLATFDADNTWVEHPYKEGVVLIGDAAAACDPSYGQGLSLTVRDVRVLRDSLLTHEDWDVAGHAYAKEHGRYYGAVYRFTQWFGQMFYATGPEAEALRMQALPLIAQDRARVPDLLASGPEVPMDDTVRRRFFGEE